MRRVEATRLKSSPKYLTIYCICHQISFQTNFLWRNWVFLRSSTFSPSSSLSSLLLSNSCVCHSSYDTGISNLLSIRSLRSIVLYLRFFFFFNFIFLRSCSLHLVSVADWMKQARSHTRIERVVREWWQQTHNQPVRKTMQDSCAFGTNTRLHTACWSVKWCSCYLCFAKLTEHGQHTNIW